MLQCLPYYRTVKAAQISQHLQFYLSYRSQMKREKNNIYFIRPIRNRVSFPVLQAIYLLSTKVIGENI